MLDNSICDIKSATKYATALSIWKLVDSPELAYLNTAPRSLSE